MTQFERVDAMEEAIIEQLGEEGALLAIIKALDTDTKEDIYKYIVRCYEVEVNEDEEEEEEI